MRFVLFTYPDRQYADTWDDLPAAERQAEIDRHIAWFQKHRDRIVGGEELAWPPRIRTVRRRDRPIVSDGPFIDTKEVIGGFVIVDVPDEAAAVEMAGEWPSLLQPGGAVEVRAVGRSEA
jgi:hypothetical protein